MASIGQARMVALYKLGALPTTWQMFAFAHQDRRGDFLAIWQEGPPAGTKAD